MRSAPAHATLKSLFSWIGGYDMGPSHWLSDPLTLPYLVGLSVLFTYRTLFGLSVLILYMCAAFFFFTNFLTHHIVCIIVRWRRPVRSVGFPTSASPVFAFCGRTYLRRRSYGGNLPVAICNGTFLRPPRDEHLNVTRRDDIYLTSRVGCV